MLDIGGIFQSLLDSFFPFLIQTLLAVLFGSTTF